MHGRMRGYAPVIEWIDGADQGGDQHETDHDDLAGIELQRAEQERQREEQQLLLQRLRDEVQREFGEAARHAALEISAQEGLEQQPRQADQNQQRHRPREILAAFHQREADPAPAEAHERQQPGKPVKERLEAAEALPPWGLGVGR